MEEKLGIIFNKVFYKYRFLFLERNKFEALTRNIKKKYLKEVSLDVCDFDYYLMELEDIARKYLVKKMKENPLEVLNNYLNIELKDIKDNLSALESITYLFSKCNINDTMIERFIKNNKTFRKIVGNVTVDNIRYIKNGNLDRAIDNKMVREIIFIYCDVEKVDVENVEFKNSNPYFGYGLPPFKSKEEEIETIKSAKNGDKLAKEEIIMRNIRLVVFLAKKYSNDTISLEDLIQEGIMGVLRAIGLYDFQYDIKFGAYAYSWIKHMISRYVITKEREFIALVNKGRLYIDYQTKYQEFYNEFGREPSLKEMAKILEVSEERLYRFLMANSQKLSLDEPVILENEVDRKEFLVDDSRDFVLEYEDKEYLANIDNLLDSMGLTKREKEVIKLRNGLDDLGITRTQVEIAAMLGLTHQRVDQLEKAGLEKIRSYMNNKEKDNKKRLKLDKKN